MFSQILDCFSCFKRKTNIFIIQNDHYFENSTSYSKTEISNVSSNKENEIIHILENCYEDNQEIDPISISDEIIINQLPKTESIIDVSKIDENNSTYLNLNNMIKKRIKIKKTDEYYISKNGKSYVVYKYKNGPKFIKLSIDKD